MVKISIIVPVYNMELYLRDCLDSLVNQSLRDIEIICVDDNSNDSSFEIIKEYADKDNRIKYDHFDYSRSALNARKRAVELSTGEYIMFLDSDDYLALDACEILYDKISKENVDILHFSSKVLNCANCPQERIDINVKLIKPYEKRLEGKAVFNECFVNKNYAFTLWNKIFRASVVKKAFMDLEEAYLPKAQDLYAFFVIAFYAESYLGWNSKNLHFYCFGRGVTGSNILSLDKFERYCHQVNIVKCLRNFYNYRIKNDNKISDVIDTYETEWLDECINLWDTSLTSGDSSEAYKILCDYWGSKRVIKALSEKFWYQKDYIAKKLDNITECKIKGKTVKNIAIYYHHYTIGGVQRVISILIPLLIKMGYNVTFVTDKEPTDKDLYLPEGVKRIYVYDYIKALTGEYYKRLDSWEKIINENQIDLVLYNAWTYPGLIWDMLYLKSKNINVVIQTHSVFSFSVNKLNNEFADFPHIFSLADGIVTLSNADRVFWSAYNNNVHYIPNPIAEDMKHDKNVDWSNKSIIWVGRVSAEKQPHYVFDIMEQIVMMCPDTKLYLVGEFSDKKWKSLAEEKNLSDNIVFCGHTTAVSQFYEKASINLITSKYEGFPMVLVEAKSFGIPTVMFEMPFLEMAKKNSGVIGVNQGDCNSAAAAITSLLKNEDLWNKHSIEAKNDFNNLYEYDYVTAWKKVLTGVEDNYPADDNVNNMIYTIVNHYTEGLKFKNQLSVVQKIKKLFTNLPRHIKTGIQSYRNNGLIYTLKKLKSKFKHYFNISK